MTTEHRTIQDPLALVEIALPTRHSDAPGMDDVDMMPIDVRDLAARARETYPIGTFAVSVWRGPRSQLLAFMCGGSIAFPDWHQVEELRLTKADDGEVRIHQIQDEPDPADLEYRLDQEVR